MKTFLVRLRAALQKMRRRIISGSASPFSRSWVCRLLSWVAVVSMIGLTSMPGLMNISVEGGPERMDYGP